MQRETWNARILPNLSEARLVIADEVVVVVVVDNHLMALPVALAGCEDDSSGAFEHGDEVGDDDGLCEQVLVGGEECGPLPAPASCRSVIVSSVTGPYGEMPSRQSLCDFVRSGHIVDPRFSVVINVSPRLCRGRCGHSHQGYQGKQYSHDTSPMVKFSGYLPLKSL